MELTKEHQAIKAWSRKYKGDNFKAVPEAILTKALETVTASNTRTIHDDKEILPFSFCPRCGCMEITSTDNMAYPPECWMKGFCSNCDFLIWLIDNSPVNHCFEWKDNNFVIDL